MQRAGGQQRVERIQDPLLLAAVRELLDAPRRPRARRPSSRRSSAGRKRPRPLVSIVIAGRCSLLGEGGHLPAQLGRLVDLLELRRIVAEIADVVQPVAALGVDEHRRDDAGIAVPGAP